VRSPPLAELFPPSTLGLEVVEVTDLTSSMRLIRLGGAELTGFVHAPGQDLMLKLAGDDGRPVSRRYSIRRFDQRAQTIELNVVLHGDGPAARWAQTVRPGDRLAEVVAPRGKITTDAAASWHLFAGDETAAPAMFNMVESLPASATAELIFEVGGPEDELVPEPLAASRLRWLHRGADQPGEGRRLLPALAEVRLPEGPVHAYLAGEGRTVLALRDLLVGRGLAREQISVKAYWRADRPNLDRGEPQPAE
jgi:NADPH-dependent ferric siderophore reductase